MPKRLKLSPHLSIDELDQRYRKSKTVTERSHYQILWLLAKGKPSEEIAAVTGYSRSWIYELVRSYNHLGVEALGDLRRYNRGAVPKLDDVQQANLLQALRGPAPDGGLWNGRSCGRLPERVARCSGESATGMGISQSDGVTLASASSSTSGERCGGARGLEKKLRNEVERVQQDYRDADIEIWCEDEHRIGLQPVVRRVWVEFGETAIATVNWKREWLWLYAFVQPKTGETYWWLLPYVNTELFNRVLKDFATHFKLGKDKRVILLLDQAGWHTTEKLQVPEGIHLLSLPPYSPELQPAERLWPLVNEPLVNQAFNSIDQVEDLIYQRCQRLLQQQALIRGLTFYHWLPNDEVA